MRLRPVAVCLMLGLCVALGPVPLPAQDDATLQIAITQEPATLMPTVGTLAVETDIAQFIFSGLTRYDERGNLIPDLATAVPTRANGGISHDGRTITFHMVRNAVWSDGQPVTSADVKFTYEAQMNPKNLVASRVPYDEIERIETPDPYTVRIITKRPWAPIMDAFSDRTTGAIIPAHLLAKYDDLNHVDFGSNPVGSGPYRLVAWHRGSDMVFEANPNFYRGVPKIKRIRMRFLTSDSTMQVALRSHELDMADTLNISTFLSLGNIEGMEPAVNVKSFWEHLTFNTARPPLDDRRVRLALCYAFDVRDLFSKVAHNLGQLGPTSENPVTPWFNKRLNYYPFDPVRAGHILDEAGWKLGSDGYRYKNGKRLSIVMVSTSGNITREQTEVILQESWRAVGVEVNIKNGPAAMVFALAANGGPIYGGNFDVALSAFIDAVPDPSRVNFNDDDRVPPNGNNISFYKNAELTQLEQLAASTFDVATRKRIYDRIQVIELRELPYYVIRWAAVTDMRSTRLQGVKPAVVGSTFWNVADWQMR